MNRKLIHACYVPVFKIWAVGCNGRYCYIILPNDVIKKVPISDADYQYLKKQGVPVAQSSYAKKYFN